MDSTTFDSATRPDGATHQEPPPPGGRDARGRFTPGNKFGPGNPFARQTARLRQVLLEVVTEEELRQVAYSLLILAKAGNLAAIKLLLQYVVGKPAEAVDPDRLEVEEWKLAQESRVPAGQGEETMQSVPVGLANVLLRHTWPAVTEGHLGPFREELEAMNAADAARAQAEQEERAEGNGEPPHPPAPFRGRSCRSKTAPRLR
jgi:hypothetical protein